MIQISIYANNEPVVEGKFQTVEAIIQLQTAIAELRAKAAPVFDPSFGAKPALIAPSEEELSAFINS